MPVFRKKNYSRRQRRKGHKNSKKVKTDIDRRRKNLKFIQRSKEAEDFQKRQKAIEDEYKRKTNLKPPIEEECKKQNQDLEEENPYETLLATLKKDNAYNVVIESSSDEEKEESDNQETENEDQNEESEGEKDHSSESEEAIQIEEEQVMEESEEGEEEEEEELDEEIEKIEKNPDATASMDSFSLHLNYELADEHISNVLAKPAVISKSKITWPELGALQIEISQSKKLNTSEDNSPEKKKKLLSDEKSYASEGKTPELLSCTNENLLLSGIKKQLVTNLCTLEKDKSNSSSDNLLSPLQTELLSIFNNYQDLFFSQRNLRNADEIRFVYCLHALNHIIKTRARVLHHNAKLAAASLNKKNLAIMPESFRDQGLVRPKILIMLPFRESAYKVVNTLIDLLYGLKADSVKKDGTIINYKRFDEEYTGNSLYFPKTNPKPEDYEMTFSGNTDDSFRIGISLTKKCIKLYTDFYSSDILIASPVALRMIIGADGDAERDYDFLSSIELLVLDQTELFYAQNWDHIIHVMDHMHLQPKSVHKTDISRVRSWCIAGQARFYRQTLLFASHELPEFRSLFNSKCNNYRGKLRTVNPIVGGSIRNVFVKIPQTFHKIDVPSLEQSFEIRFKYFINIILPQFKNPSMAHCMIYVPSYFDYVRLRNYFKSETINFVQICEYTKDKKIARARDMFFHSGAHFLLYSERAHFFRRTRIKGIRHLIMYQPPCWPNFYPELINLMQEANQNARDGLETCMSITILYTKYDMLQISSIIGTDRAAKLLQSITKTNVFPLCE